MKSKKRNMSNAEEKKNGEQRSNGSSGGKQHKRLNDLLETGLKDMLSAEKQLVEALPEIAQAADNEELEEAINQHLEQTKKHVARIEKACERLEIQTSDSEKCAAMEGLIEEGRKIIKEFPRGPVRDSALIIGSQKIEHYEIASYGSLCELCDVLGEDRIHDLLGRTLSEEEETDELLTEIAQDINDEAAEAEMQEADYA
jgi:ferritin-like metal-binding protein YciE